jgi:cytochrome c-type biogenesis protein
MDFGPGTYFVGYLAGLLSTLSPCVLPLLPILVATALRQHRHGAMALAAGLALSFTALGLFVALLGVSIGIDGGVLRGIAAWLLIGFALVLLLAPLQRRFAAVTAGIGAAGSGWLSTVGGEGWRGQFAVGALLGIVWSPCVGPTLGAATTLAAQGRSTAAIAALLLVFGIGAATPLVAVGSLSREASARLRARLARAGAVGNRLLGALLLAVGVAIVTGADKAFETWAVEHSPGWLTALTTRY